MCFRHLIKCPKYPQVYYTVLNDICLLHSLYRHNFCTVLYLEGARALLLFDQYFQAVRNLLTPPPETLLWLIKINYGWKRLGLVNGGIWVERSGGF